MDMSQLTDTYTSKSIAFGKNPDVILSEQEGDDIGMVGREGSPTENKRREMQIIGYVTAHRHLNH